MKDKILRTRTTKPGSIRWPIPRSGKLYDTDGDEYPEYVYVEYEVLPPHYDEYSVTVDIEPTGRVLVDTVPDTFLECKNDSGTNASKIISVGRMLFESGYARDLASDGYKMKFYMRYDLLTFYIPRAQIVYKVSTFTGKRRLIYARFARAVMAFYSWTLEPTIYDLKDYIAIIGDKSISSDGLMTVTW